MSKLFKELRVVWESTYDSCIALGATSTGVLAVCFQEGFGGLSGAWWIPFVLWFVCGVLFIPLQVKYIRGLLVWLRSRDEHSSGLSLGERVMRESESPK